ncbi:hypothetical protein [Haloferax sp. YSMS24]|uniref:hypothetical protein n=1 Tax=Haloferax sp. YSMS24 TaxID=3388425 RepID=UPI00398C9C26
MSELTPLQEQIVEVIAGDPELSNSSIAEEVGCSASYVSEVKSEFAEVISQRPESPDLTVAPLFSEPSNVYISESCIDKFGLSQSEYCELTYSVRGRPQPQVTKFKSINEFSPETELHHLFYEINNSFPNLDSRVVDFFDHFYEDESDDLNIYSPSALNSFLDNLSNYRENLQQKADILIGTELLRSYNREIEDPTQVVITPSSRRSASVTREFLAGRFRRLIELKPFEGEVRTPDVVYFTRQATIPEEIEERIREKICDIEIFDSRHIYSIHDGVTVFGPSAPSGDDTSAIRVTEGNLQLVVNNVQTLTLTERIVTDDMPSEDIDSKSINFEQIDNLISEMSIEIPPDGERDSEPVELQINMFSHPKVGHIHFEFSQLTVTFLAHNNNILWIYPNSIPVVDKFVGLITELIIDEFNFTVEKKDTQKITGEPPIQGDEYVFDTNALYHQIGSQKPTNILHTVIPNPSLYDSTISVPWIVLYEINKHKDRGSASPKAQKQGIDNLLTLKALSEFGLIELDVQSAPEDSSGQISESDVADIQLLGFVQSRDAILITGDKRLREVAEIGNTKLIDINEYAVVEQEVSLSQSVREEILHRIGDELHTADEILDEIKTELTKITRESKGDSSHQKPPETYLKRWVSNNDIIPFYDPEEDELSYTQSTSYDIVPTQDTVRRLCESIEKHDGAKYLNKSSLEKLKDVVNMSEPGFPWVTFRLPVSTILAPQSSTIGGLSTEARRLYNLKGVKNSSYVSTEIGNALSSGDYVHDSVLLARELECILLCSGSEEYLYRIGGILGAKIQTID